MSLCLAVLAGKGEYYSEGKKMVISKLGETKNDHGEQENQKEFKNKNKTKNSCMVLTVDSEKARKF